MTAFVIGRFAPCHLGHVRLIQRASDIDHEDVVVLLGSCDAMRSARNPFTPSQRKQIILDMVRQHLASPPKLKFIELRDDTYNDQEWYKTTSEIIRANTNGQAYLVGSSKADTAYLKEFEHVAQYVEVAQTSFGSYSCASDIREKVYKFILGHSSTFEYELRNNYLTPSLQLAWDAGAVTYQYNQQYKLDYPAPYHVTCDAFVWHAGKVLLIKRKNAPGKGLWALPGGFLEKDERVIDGIKRELKEETGLEATEICKTYVFDHPTRSERARIITHCGVIRVTGVVPKVVPADDACEFTWMAPNDIQDGTMFEDHRSIIKQIVRDL